MYCLNVGGETFEFDLSKEFDQKKMIEKLLIAYRHKFPFFINLLIALCDINHVEEQANDSLAYTKLNINSERIDIFINFEIIQKKEFDAELILFLIFHELLHNYLYHFARFNNEMKEGNGQIVNIVTDYYVNSLCEELIGYGLMKQLEDKELKGITYNSIEGIAKENNAPDFPDEHTLRGKWTERTLYEYLKKHLPQINMFDFGDEQNVDNHEESNKEETKETKKNKDGKTIDQQAIKDIFINKIKAVENEIKSYGYSNEEMGVIERKQKLTQPNYFLNTLKLKRILCNALESNKEKTYSTINRKRQLQDIVLKGKKKTKGYKLVVGIDVSGSISNEDLITFMNMLLGLNKKKQDVLFDIIFWSSCEVKNKTNAFKNIKDVKTFFSQTKIHSSGGTEVETFHKYLNTQYNEPIEVINITDGCFSYDRDLENHIMKYHFVLTDHINNSFEHFYSSKPFEVVSIKQQDVI